MSSNQESLELELLKFFKQNLVKYIHINKHQGFQKHFLHHPSYTELEVKAALSQLIEQGYLNQLGELLYLSTKGSDKSCENLEKKP